MSDITELTAGNFNHKVLQSDGVWVVVFMVPWNGHCRALDPELEKAATTLKGIAHLGTVDMDVHGSVGGPYNVRGFPTIKIFAENKKSPQDYNGVRSAQAIAEEVLRVLGQLLRNRLPGRGSYRTTAANAVVELTDANFETEVLNSPQPVMVKFVAPWCGHSQRLAPEWKNAATALQGKVKLASLDATAHTHTAAQFQVQGYPIIKIFRHGAKTYSTAEDYQGGRTASDIVAYGFELDAANITAPAILPLVNNVVLRENVNEKPLGVIAFLPTDQATENNTREDHLDLLAQLGEKYKGKQWGWVWTEVGTHPPLEQVFGITASDCPTLVAVNIRKQVYVRLRGEFSLSGIDEFLKSIAVGRVRTEMLPQSLPTLATVAQ